MRDLQVRGAEGLPRSTRPANWPESWFVCFRLKMINSHLITTANFCSSFQPYLRLSLPKLINLHELSYFPTNFPIASLCLLSLVSENSAVKKPKSFHAKGINRVPFLAGACGKAQRNSFQALFQAGPCGWLRRWLAWIIMTWLAAIYHLRNYILWGFFICACLLNYELRTCVCACACRRNLLSQFFMQRERRAESRTPSTINRFDISQRENNELAGVDGNQKMKNWNVQRKKVCAPKTQREETIWHANKVIYYHRRTTAEKTFN